MVRILSRNIRKKLKSLSFRSLRGIQHLFQLRKRRKKLKRRIRRFRQRLPWSTLTVYQSQEALRTLEAKVT